ncbi:MAG TPA: bifunctional GNAT family N-acetyltransferase/class I SAM-dependent methyltransferase [Kofleriaceae bacterium]|nr:bifunctional GNAT family N-acetyltransferase/class I SAM-dependent methyltransferase [Kofleriaceae bacterium]
MTDATAQSSDVIVRGARRSDVPALLSIMAQPGVIRGTTVMPGAGELAVEAALAAPDRHWLIAAAAADDRALGYVYLDWGHGRWRRIASLVMAVHDAAVGRGIGRQLLDAAIGVGFQYLDLQRIELEVYVDNAAAIRLYERAGFVREGTKRRNAIRDGVHVDGHVMALLKPLAAAATAAAPAPPAAAYTDQAHLLSHSYGATDDYQIRSAGWDRYRVGPVSLVPWVLDKLPLGEPLALLDAGCGLGRFALAAAERAPRGSAITAIDLSRAMIDAVSAEARRRGLAIDATVGSLEELPYTAGTFDAVLCNYVLYHVESIPRAIDELARVLRPGGLLVAMVPAFRWLHELIDWQDRALLRLGHDPGSPLLGPTGTDRCCEENAPRHLARRFRVIARDRHDGTMRFPSVDELVHHYRHTMRFRNAVAAGVDGDRLADSVRELMAETLARGEELRVTSLGTCFVCRKEA